MERIDDPVAGQGDDGTVDGPGGRAGRGWGGDGGRMVLLVGDGDELDLRAEGEAEALVDTSGAVVALGDVQDGGVAVGWIRVATWWVSRAASPWPRASGWVHTALTSM